MNEYVLDETKIQTWANQDVLRLIREAGNTEVSEWICMTCEHHIFRMEHKPKNSGLFGIFWSEHTCGEK